MSTKTIKINILNHTCVPCRPASAAPSTVTATTSSQQLPARGLKRAVTWSDTLEPLAACKATRLRATAPSSFAEQRRVHDAPLSARPVKGLKTVALHGDHDSKSVTDALHTLHLQPNHEAWADAFTLQGNEARFGAQYLRSHRPDPTKNPIITTDKQWHQYVPCSQEAAAELPWCIKSLRQIDAAHGTANNAKHEPPHIAKLQSLPLPNLPAERMPLPRAKPQQPTRLPRRGCYNDFFRTEKGSYSFTAAEHGPWVRVRLRALGRSRGGDSTKWTLSADDFEREIDLWFETTRQDLLRAKEWTKQGKIGKFRPNSAAWVIPENAFALWSIGFIWDTREYFTVHKSDRHKVQIEPQCWAHPGATSWNTDEIWRLGIQSGCTDVAGLSDLCEHGVTLPHHGEYSMVLAPCSASYYADLEIGQTTSHEEVDSGILQTPCLGPPLTPFKISPRAIARVFKDGKIKDRCVANLGFPQAKGMEHHAVNFGFDLKDTVNFPEIDYISPASIAHYAAILIPICGDDFVLARNDWSKWYRSALSFHPTRVTSSADGQSDSITLSRLPPAGSCARARRHTGCKGLSRSPTAPRSTRGSSS